MYFIDHTVQRLCTSSVEMTCYSFLTLCWYLFLMLQFTPLPVWHGQGYRSLGFRFGNICYVRWRFFNRVCGLLTSKYDMLLQFLTLLCTIPCSDVSEIPEETYALLKDCDVLILVLSLLFVWFLFIKIPKVGTINWWTYWLCRML